MNTYNTNLILLCGSMVKICLPYLTCLPVDEKSNDIHHMNPENSIIFMSSKPYG